MLINSNPLIDYARVCPAGLCCLHSRTQTHAHTHTYTHTYSPHTHTHTHTNTHTHTYTHHTHTNTHTHTYTHHTQASLGMPVDPNVPMLAFIGRLDPQKGADILLEAMSSLLVRQNVQLVCLGTGNKDLEVRGCGGFAKKGCECALLCSWCASAQAARI